MLVENLLHLGITERGALVGGQRGDDTAGLAVIDQRIRHFARYLGALGDRGLLLGAGRADDVYRVLVAEDLGELQNGQRHLLHVLRHLDRDVVRQIRAGLQVAG